MLLLLVSSMFFLSFQNVYAEQSIDVDTTFDTDQTITEDIKISSGAELVITFGTTITMKGAGITNEGDLIIDGTLLYDTTDDKNQFFINFGKIKLRCGIFPSPNDAFSFANVMNGLTLDTGCPGNIDRIILDGDIDRVEMGETVTIPSGREVIIINNLYVAGEIINHGTVTNEGLITLDSGATINNIGTWNNICGSFDTRGIESSGSVNFFGNDLLNIPCTLPIAVDDKYETNEDITLTVPAPGVLINDSDADGDLLTASLNGIPPTFGDVNMNQDGSFVYTPIKDFFGTDKFSYKVDDGRGGFATATVEITVIAVNDPPIAVADSYSVNQSGVLEISKPGLLSNDFDIDSDRITAEFSQPPTNGEIIINPDGSFIYTPDPDFFGVDSVKYGIFDGEFLVEGDVTFTVNALSTTDLNESAIDRLQSLKNELNKEGKKKIDEALEYLNESIFGELDDNGTLFLDELHLPETSGDDFFNTQIDSSKKLMEIIKKPGEHGASDSDVAEIIDIIANQMIKADRNVALTAINDAAGGDSDLIKEANKEMDTAEKNTSKGKYDKAIENYFKVWEFALKAT